MLEFFYQSLTESRNAVVSMWIGIFILWTLLLALSRVFAYVKQSKIQSRKLRWPIIRHELLWSFLNVGITTLVLVSASAWLINQGYLTTDTSPATWYVIAYEFALYFFIFDFYFYCVHRLFHIEPLYTWIHKIHHHSTVPNPLSYSSMTPIEGIAEGMIIPIFLTLFTVHEASMIFILPFASLMGLYVHCGYELVPRWWYRSPVTKWFITPMYHDQHHQFFTCNYGAYTTIWDRAFGSIRERFMGDFDKLRDRRAAIPPESELV